VAFSQHLIAIAPLLALSLILTPSASVAAESEGYVRFCASSETLSDADVERRIVESNKQIIDFQSQLHLPRPSWTNAYVVEKARASLSTHSILSRESTLIDASLVVRNYSAALQGLSPMDGTERDVVRLRTDRGDVLALIAFDARGLVTEMRPISNSELRRANNFGRWFAAYMLLNDLAASDDASLVPAARKPPSFS
jgi:hypothetical protein